MRQFASGRYPARQVVKAAGDLARAPRAALDLAQIVSKLDLTSEMRRVRARGRTRHRHRLHQ